MSEFASSSFTAGKLNAIVKKLGGESGAKEFLRGGLTSTLAKSKPLVLPVRLEEAWPFRKEQKY